MKRILTSEVFIVLVLSAIILTLNGFVWFSRIAQTPYGHEFIPIHNSLDDYPFYVSVIKQGIEGGRGVFDRFAVEPHQGSVLHLFYLLQGWVGGLLGVTSAHLIYHMSRYIFGAFWCMAILWLCDTLIPDKRTRLIAFFFALFSASFPKIDAQGVSWFMSWWTELDPVARAAFVPHFTLGHIALVAALISIFYYERTGLRKWLYRGGAASFIAAFVHPPSFIQIALVVPLYVLLVRRRHWIIGALVLLVSGGLGLVVINNATRVFPWNLARAFEGTKFFVSPVEYLAGLGPVVALSIIGAVTRRKSQAAWLLILWIVTSMIMIPVSSYLPISDIRFLQVAIWVPLAILGAFGLTEIFSRFGKKVGTIFFVVFCVLTFMGYPSAIEAQIRRIYFSSDYTYPKIGYLKGIEALGILTQPDQHVLSLSLGGMTAPMYVNRASFVGQIVYTPDRERKLTQSWLFFHGGMTQCEAYTFLKVHRIGAVLFSFDEYMSKSSVSLYPFLQPWNTYGETTVYTVVNSPPVGCTGT